MTTTSGKEGVFVKLVWFDGEIPVPEGYELADKEEEKQLRDKVKPGEYFVAHLLTPSSEPRIAFYTVRWQGEKNGWSTRTHGSMVAQAKLRCIKTC